MHYKKTNAKEVKEVALKAFPQYKGRKFAISTMIPQSLDSYWEGGSRDYYAFINLSTKQVVSVGSNHPYYEKDKPRELGGNLPQGIAIVKRSIFCGKETGLTVIVNPTDLNPRWIEERNNQGVER